MVRLNCEQAKTRASSSPGYPSFFSDHAHRSPEAGKPMGYAMACVEVVANWSPRGGELYRELVKAWAAPGAKAFYEPFIAKMSEEGGGHWEDVPVLRQPILGQA